MTQISPTIAGTTRDRASGAGGRAVAGRANGSLGTANGHARSAVTWLVVSASVPGRFQRAANSGADAIVIDLDGSVAPADKTTARVAAIRYISTGRPAYVQVNRPGSAALTEDLAALADAGPALRGVIVPGPERPEQLEALDSRLPPGVVTIALIQSPGGLLAAHEIACAARVARLGFGAASLAAGIGIEDQAGLMVARSLLVLASGAQSLAGPIDSSSLEINDLARVTMEAEASRRLGFTGTFCTKPQQVLPAAFGFQRYPAVACPAR